jgi:hypothetical protein
MWWHTRRNQIASYNWSWLISSLPGSTGAVFFILVRVSWGIRIRWLVCSAVSTSYLTEYTWCVQVDYAEQCLYINIYRWVKHYSNKYTQVVDYFFCQYISQQHKYTVLSLHWIVSGWPRFHQPNCLPHSSPQSQNNKLVFRTSWALATPISWSSFWREMPATIKLLLLRSTYVSPTRANWSI